MNKKEINSQEGLLISSKKPKAKALVRIISFVVIFALLYQDVVWSIGMDLSYLFAPPVTNKKFTENIIDKTLASISFPKVNACLLYTSPSPRD